MTKSELIDRIYGLGFDLNKRDVEILVHALFDVLQTEITSTGRFSYPGFGTFTVRERKARTGRNPQTGKAIQIAASKTVGFKPSPSFKGSL